MHILANPKILLTAPISSMPQKTGQNKATCIGRTITCNNRYLFVFVSLYKQVNGVLKCLGIKQQCCYVIKHDPCQSFTKKQFSSFYNQPKTPFANTVTDCYNSCTPVRQNKTTLWAFLFAIEYI